MQHDYAERVYAGVLGKIIGVYLGRPFEQWSFERITERFDEINYYVNDQLGQPLVVADDDISGTFTFLRALPDNGCNPNLTPNNIGDTWLNYIIEDRTILWWGGMGVSTEHTAYLRLKSGIPAPASGSIGLNSQVVAEQIGAQIFIDGWGMVCPGDPARAADFARRAASVSHDGEAIHAAQMVAALVAEAFRETDINKLLDTALRVIPSDCLIARVIADVRAWHSETPADWRATRAKIAERYGYQCFGGECHVVPNHALIIHALLHGDGDFSKSMMIVNTCGWDTDCNAANVGCILAVRGGLDAFDGAHDWRGPVADRLFLPTADGGRCVTDAVQEALRITRIGQSLAGEPSFAPKGGAQFSFAFPGSVQGFRSEHAVLANALLPSTLLPNGKARGLKVMLSETAPDKPALVQTPTFLLPEELGQGGYGLTASPTLYPGQTLEAGIILDGDSPAPLRVRLSVQHYADGNELTPLAGPWQTILPGEEGLLQWTVPSTGSQPIAAVGIEIVDATHAPVAIYVDYLRWSGAPDCHLHRPDAGSAWQKAWVSSASVFKVIDGTTGFRIAQNQGTGMASQGTREWTDYSVTADIKSFLCERFGLACRVQGLRRFYALFLTQAGTVQIVKALNEGEVVAAEVPYDWQPNQMYAFLLTAEENLITGYINGKQVLEFRDENSAFRGGAIGIICTNGNAVVQTVRVAPLNRNSHATPQVSVHSAALAGSA